jgi:hypothetical protein
LNSVERRIEVLRDQLRAFTAIPEARLLCWLVSADEIPMVDAFVELESDEHAGELPALFVRFEQPFDDPRGYSLALRAAFLEHYEESREGLGAEDIDDAWVCPAAGGATSDLDALVRCLCSFCAQYETLVEHLILVLRPSHIEDAGAFQRWLEDAVRGVSPTRIRFVVLDHRDAPALAGLVKRDPARVAAMTPALDMPAAFEELSAAAGRLDTPGGMFRHLFVQLSRAAAKGDMPSAESLGARAIEAAEKSGWHHLAAVVHFALGSTLLTRGEYPEAILRYRQADSSAEAAARAGEPSAPKIRLNARMAIGAALLSAGAFDEAADVYEATAPLAEAQGDKLLQMECWRMAGYSHERAGARERAKAAGEQALRVGEAMSGEERARSTLAYAGEGLLRAARLALGDRKAVEARMVDLLGPDWRPAAKSEVQRP